MVSKNRKKLSVAAAVLSLVLLTTACRGTEMPYDQHDPFEIGKEQVGRVEAAVSLDVFERLIILPAVQIAEKTQQDAGTLHRDLGGWLGTRHKT